MYFAVLPLGDLLAGSLEFVKAFDSPPRRWLIVVEVQVMKEREATTDIIKNYLPTVLDCSTRDLDLMLFSCLHCIKSATFSYKYRCGVIQRSLLFPGNCGI